jgi:predicted nuclease of predicted toxin-antitoxin system
MRFLIDRCAGRRISEWLRSEGHDVVDSPSLGPDPGDVALLQQAFRAERVLVTIDTDFGKLIFFEEIRHCGLIRLPDVPPAQRIALMADLLEHHSQALAAGAVITIKGDRIRIAWRSGQSPGSNDS